MPSRPIRPAEYPLEFRRSEIERIRELEGQVWQVEGFIDVDGYGGGLLEVNFPVWFSERPNIAGGGGELAPNQVLVDGSFPTWNVGVKDWAKAERAEKEYYVGATLIIVVSGWLDMRSTAHWTARGMALANPLADDGDIEGA